MRWLAVAATVFLIGTGVAGAQPPPPGYAQVPPPREERVPPPRGPREIWEPGHWQWNGRRYIWVAGHYVERRPQYGHYEPGHWVWAPGQNRYVWRSAHWE